MASRVPKSKQTYRQGDILIRRVAEIPEGLAPVKPDLRGRLVLAEGEATGHAHAVAVAPGISLGRGADGDLYLSLPDGGSVVHDEHDAIPLAPGNYRVGRQREYSPEEVRRVAD